MFRVLLPAVISLIVAFVVDTATAQGRPAPSGTAAPAAPAAPKPSGTAAASRVDVQISVVHATDSESGIDPRLSALASSFRYFKYKGYRLLSTQDADVSVGEDHSFPIEGNRRLKVTLISRDDTRARVRVEMTSDDGKLLDTTVSINRGGTFIVAGPRFKDGILMLPVRADY
ncbi:MAG: hypothetical protein Q8P18_23495 [Pseudomonadota bacterium]|nr:hypothetical protein [Pseudomonadota bacterium]